MNNVDYIKEYINEQMSQRRIRKLKFDSHNRDIQRGVQLLVAQCNSNNNAHVCSIKYPQVNYMWPKYNPTIFYEFPPPHLYPTTWK